MSGERAAVQLLVDTTNAPQGLSAAAYAVQYPACSAPRQLWPLRVFPVRRRICRWYRVPIVSGSTHQDERWFQSISHVLRMITLLQYCCRPPRWFVKGTRTVEQLLVSPISPFSDHVSKVLAMSGSFSSRPRWPCTACCTRCSTCR